jgi:ABC-type bacteriocin/lantibiotic exporter with double-glycine peptidase domain
LTNNNEDKFIFIKGVPFIKQKENFCSEASFTMLGRFYGKNITQEQVAEMDVEEGDDFCYYFDQLLPCFRDIGLDCKLESDLELKDIEEQLKNNNPVIVRTNPIQNPIGALHTIVVVGITDKDIIVNDPAKWDWKGRFIPINQFKIEWSAYDNSAIICKKPK